MHLELIMTKLKNKHNNQINNKNCDYELQSKINKRPCTNSNFYSGLTHADLRLVSWVLLIPTPLMVDSNKVK